MWDILIKLMTEIVALYRNVLEISGKKKQALISARIEEIAALTKQEESFILQIGKLEAARRKTVAELAGLYALPSKDFTLAKTKELADAETAAKLEQLETELRDILSKLIPLNKTNTALIERALNYVNFNLNLLTQDAVNPNYAAKGQGEPQRPKAVIDAKV